ncbi:alpha/beta fold hydrolase [Nannocystaceae bacterium ST9]
MTAALVSAGPSVLLSHRAWRRQRARAALRLATPNRIEEAGFLRIGGIEQWLSLRGEDRRNPVLLELHGGPGASNTIFTNRTRTWEKHFTLARWDMRGAGKTYAKGGESQQGELGFARIEADAIEVAQYVRSTVGAPIVLLANSFGTTFGLRVARARPDLFAAYVGTDQHICDASGVDPAYAGSLERLRAAGKARDVATLAAIGADTYEWSARDWSESARIVSRSDPRLAKVLKNVVAASLWFSPLHRLSELPQFAEAMNFSARLRLEAVHFDAVGEGVTFDVPFFIFQGEHDILTPVDVASRFWARVKAPTKDFAVIRGATHFASFADPEAFLELLVGRVLPNLRH